jgi:mannonate dehydratase
MSIRVAVGQFHDLTDERLRFAAQIGATGLQMNNPTLPGDTHWEEKDIRALVRKTEKYGLKFEAIENVPTHFYNKVMLGQPGRDEQIENYKITIRNVGRAGVPVLGYHFMPNSVWTTDRRAKTRGGATARKFDMTAVEAVADSVVKMKKMMPTTLGRQSTMPAYARGDTIVTEEEMWANYEYFIKAVLPTAEEAGVRLAGKSPAWALDLCLGCCSEMTGGKKNVKEMIEFFGPKGAIAYIHFRDVQGTVPNFTECFIGDGNYDPAEVMALLDKTGFDGFLLDDHVPKMDDDSDWNHRGRAHAIGYMQGLIRMLELNRKRAA